LLLVAPNLSGGRNSLVKNPNFLSVWGVFWHIGAGA